MCLVAGLQVLRVKRITTNPHSALRKPDRRAMIRTAGAGRPRPRAAGSSSPGDRTRRRTFPSPVWRLRQTADRRSSTFSPDPKHWLSTTGFSASRTCRQERPLILAGISLRACDARSRCQPPHYRAHPASLPYCVALEGMGPCKITAWGRSRRYSLGPCSLLSLL